MPVYEYVCTACGRSVEVMHGINVPGPTTCSACGGALRKALSPPAIVFKGTGWAKQDARSASARSSSGSAGSETSGPKAREGVRGEGGEGASDGGPSASPKAASGAASSSGSATGGTPGKD
jgi:putative FmdB family regulatory protein